MLIAIHYSFNYICIVTQYCYLKEVYCVQQPGEISNLHLCKADHISDQINFAKHFKMSDEDSYNDSQLKFWEVLLHKFYTVETLHFSIFNNLK